MYTVHTGPEQPEFVVGFDVGQNESGTTAPPGFRQ